MKGQRPSATPAKSPVPARKKFVTPRDVCLGALLFIATLVAYGPALNGGQIWDDDAHVTATALRTLHGLWRIWFELGATQQYYPLLHSAFWVEHRLWGDAVFGYHLTNVMLHATSACLVVAIMRRMALPGAWLAGFIFALHPVCVETVAWISEQKSTLSTVFYLSSALTYLRFDQTRRRSHYFLAFGLFVLALLSKTVTATLPAALLVIFWWKRGRLDWKRDILPLLPWLVFGAIAGLFTAWVEQNYIGAKGATFTLTLLERLLLAGRVIWFYLGKLLWPANLIFTYPHWRIDPAVWWQYLFPVGIVALTGGLLLTARRQRGPLAAFLFFAGTLFPVLGFFNVFPFKYSYVADHFQYLACLGIIVLFSSGLAPSVDHLRATPRRLVYGLFGALLLTAGGLTFRQCNMYRDSVTLYRETLARNPDDWMGHINLAVIWTKTPGHLTEAAVEYQAALQLNPDEAEAHSYLGVVLANIPGRLQDAIAELEAGLRLGPNAADVHNNFGMVLARIPSRSAEAVAEFRTALRIEPNNAEIHYNLGNALTEIPGHLPEAIAEYEAALRIDPDFAEAHDALGCALGDDPAKLPDAITHFQAAVQIKPDYADAHYNLANALMNIPGRGPEARAEYEAVLRINPDDAETHNDLGRALANTPGRMADAITHFQAAIRIKPDYAEAHQNLGLALSTMPGRSQDAIEELKAALRINPDLESARQALKQLQGTK